MSDLVEFCGEIRREKAKAIMVYDGKEEIWLPRSMIKAMRQVGTNRADFVFEIPEWIARDKGIV